MISASLYTSDLRNSAAHSGLEMFSKLMKDTSNTETLNYCLCLCRKYKFFITEILIMSQHKRISGNSESGHICLHF